MTDHTRATIRKSFFQRIFQICLRTLPEVFKDAQFDDDDADILATLFFGMSDNYKDWRLVDPALHRTNDYKKAGLTIAAIMAMRPISFSIPQDNSRGLYANQLFAMCCATGILKCPLSSMLEEDRTQFYLWLNTLRFPSTIPLLKNPKRNTAVKVTLTYAELSNIDMIVQKVRDFCKLYDLEVGIEDQSHDA